MSESSFFGLNIILLGVVGSHAYGLNHEGSDIDRAGIFVLPTRDFLGLQSPNLSKVQQGHEYPEDYSFHEVAKFLSLALACNPTVAELLWLDGYEVLTDKGAELVGMRKSFLSAKSVRDSYLGYATSQRGRVMRETANPIRREKAARHILRLVRQGVSLWQTGELALKVSDPEEYFAFGKRAAETDDLSYLDAALTEAEAVFDSQPTSLPQAPDRERANEWLTQLRVDALAAKL